MRKYFTKTKKVLFLALIIIVCFCSVAFAAETRNPSVETPNWGKLSEIYQFLKENYVEDVDFEKLEEGAIEGMLNSLGDPYSEYFSDGEYEDFKSDLEGQLVGIGVQVEKKDNYVTVVAPLPDTPAEKAGIKAGDKIIKVDGKDAVSISLNEAVEMIKGQAGTSVTLTILRDGQEKEYLVKREKIQLETITSQILKDDIGYISIKSFSSTAGEQFVEELEKLKAQGVKKVVLDLRNNPGGHLNSALIVASVFVPDGGILLHIENRTKDEVTFRSKHKGKKMPVVVLVNEGSASASEVVAGAIKDNKAGELVGTQTFGKATVQTLHHLKDNGYIKVTTERYLTPNRTKINGLGLVPDIEIKDSLKQLEIAINLLEGKTIDFKESFNLSFKPGGNTVNVNGILKKIEQASYIENGTTMVPLRSFCTLLGAEIKDFKDGKITMVKNYKEYKIDLENNPNARVKNGVTYVHAKYFAKLFNGTIFWDKFESRVKISF